MSNLQNPLDSVVVSDKVVSASEMIVLVLNYWHRNLIQRTSEYLDAISRYKENPNAMILTQRAIDARRYEGEPMIGIVRSRIEALKEARSHVAALEKMLGLLKVQKNGAFLENVEIEEPDESLLRQTLK